MNDRSEVISTAQDLLKEREHHLKMREDEIASREEHLRQAEADLRKRQHQAAEIEQSIEARARDVAQREIEADAGFAAAHGRRRRRADHRHFQRRRDCWRSAPQRLFGGEAWHHRLS